MKKNLGTQLSLTIIFIVLIAVGIISIVSDYLIDKQFADYMISQRTLNTQIITSSIGYQYMESTNTWNADNIQAIGILSLNEGYIIKVYDKSGNILWDAKAYDRKLCHQIMNNISGRMEVKYPQMKGKFQSVNYPVIMNGRLTGYVNISYFGPFFLNQNDFRFHHAFNIILISVGIISILIATGVGHFLVRRIRCPIIKTAEAAKQIADGNYNVRLKEKTSINELNMLTESVNHLAVSLDSMEKTRIQITRDMAHELRTPITILQSYLEAMTDGVWEASGERLLRCYVEVRHIGRLVADLEKISRLESDKLKLNKQNMDLYELIEKTIHDFDGEIDYKKLKVKLEGEHVTLTADPKRLKQVICNLLANAIKYSREESVITFTTFVKTGAAGFLIIDNGIGIPKAELPFIFERFYRADKSRNRATGGTGIGLSIVKSIVEAHGGRVFAESVINEGSKFTIILPKEL